MFVVRTLTSRTLPKGCRPMPPPLYVNALGSGTGNSAGSAGKGVDAGGGCGSRAYVTARALDDAVRVLKKRA